MLCSPHSHHSPFHTLLRFSLSLSRPAMNRATSRGSTDEAKQQRLKVKREVETYSDQDSDDDGGSGHVGPQKGAFPGTGSAKRGSAAGAPARCCQAERCAADLGDAKLYHRRHRVCEHHAKAQVVLVGGIRQRFCQQCSRFHELAEFDEAKRSCRRRLAGHNERRRKSAAEAHVEGSGRKGAGLKDLVCGKVDERGRIQISIHDNSSYKHFHVR